MGYVWLALLLLAAFVPAAILVLRTNQVKKRGCGRGCATCADCPELAVCPTVGGILENNEEAARNLGIGK